MTTKNISARIINKHDIEDNWKKATKFVPLKGEVIIYDRDSKYNFERMKVGDGETLVSNLPFVKGEKGETGPQGDPGVELRTTAPTNPNTTVWINPNGSTSTDSFYQEVTNRVLVDPTFLNALNQKLDKPDAKGSLNQFLVSDGNGGTKWITLANAEEVYY